MVEPFIGELKAYSFDWAPKGWAACDGAILPIQQNQPLFSLLGTAFGGDGRTTFGLPDLRGRIPMHTDGGSFSIGLKGGEETHTLTGQQMPAPHNHFAFGTSDAANNNAAAGNLFATVNGANAYTKTNPPQPIVGSTISTVGGAAHQNMSPYLALNFCIALVGIFPPRP